MGSMMVKMQLTYNYQIRNTITSRQLPIIQVLNYIILIPKIIGQQMKNGDGVHIWILTKSTGRMLCYESLSYTLFREQSKIFFSAKIKQSIKCC